MISVNNTNSLFCREDYFFQVISMLHFWQGVNANFQKDGWTCKCGWQVSFSICSHLCHWLYDVALYIPISSYRYSFKLHKIHVIEVISVFLVLEMIIKTKPKNITPIWTHLKMSFVFFLGAGKWKCTRSRVVLKFFEKKLTWNRKIWRNVEKSDSDSFNQLNKNSL